MHVTPLPKALQLFRIPLWVNTSLTMAPQALCVCPLPPLLPGPHCLLLFPSPLCSSPPCLLANPLAAKDSPVSGPLHRLFPTCPHVSLTPFLQVSEFIREAFSDHPLTLQVFSLPTAFTNLKAAPFSLP